MSKATWEMSGEQLAQTFAEHYGFEGKAGGWIYSPSGRPVAHGWQSFAEWLRVRGYIRTGKSAGINWLTATRAKVGSL